MDFIGASIIAFLASHMNVSCEEAFTMTAQQATNNIVADEVVYLERLAAAACATTNPDIIWKIAYRESTFRFLMVRINASKQNKTPRILRGNEAVAYLKALEGHRLKGRTNVDVGVMQINWFWHQKTFGTEPLDMLDPANQVAYFANGYGEDLKRMCSQDWVGCYHNPSDKKAASAYQEKIHLSRQLLIEAAMSILKKWTKTQPVIDGRVEFTSLKKFEQARQNTVFIVPKMRDEPKDEATMPEDVTLAKKTTICPETFCTEGNQRMCHGQKKNTCSLAAADFWPVYTLAAEALDQKQADAPWRTILPEVSAQELQGSQILLN